MVNTLKQCPCGSESDYLACCGQYLQHQAFPPTPEALMRSRYTAYTCAEVDYIEKTMRGKALSGFDATSVAAWANSVLWLGLTVLASQQENDSRGSVEFIATYLENHALKTIHEISEFHKIDGVWFYTDGQQKHTPDKKIARNTLCPCSSKKKFKNCHGRA